MHGQPVPATLTVTDAPPTASAPDEALVDELQLNAYFHGQTTARNRQGLVGACAASSQSASDALKARFREKERENEGLRKHIDQRASGNDPLTQRLRAEIERLTGAIRWALDPDITDEYASIGALQAELRRRAFGDEEVAHG